LSELLRANTFYSSTRVAFDPDNNQPFANNIIPVSRLSPNGRALLNAYPLPTPGSISVSESIRGALPVTYTFRQFGLLKARPTPDGKRLMMPAPDGFPRFASGENVLVFFYPQAKQTGLRTTAGLVQGKFNLGPGFATNGTGNVGLFRNVSLEEGLVEESDNRLLATQSGAINPDSFLSFLRRAVAGRWVETGRLASLRTSRR
jgi:hypothetical protein